mmetsp:Transcript_5375/g.6413  ORF Transcript_5375/g.6413 Transcript_5375/m.6413 type:complete len:134 (-) Transcript_5375:1018-1419(-)
MERNSQSDFFRALIREEQALRESSLSVLSSDIATKLKQASVDLRKSFKKSLEKAINQLNTKMAEEKSEVEKSKDALSGTAREVAKTQERVEEFEEFVKREFGRVRGEVESGVGGVRGEGRSEIQAVMKRVQDV